MKKIALATVAALALVGSSAFAVNAQTGFFVDGGVGLGQLASPTQSNGTDLTSHKNYGLAWNANVGYQQVIDRNFSVGLEVGYAQFGKSKSSGFNGDSTYTNKGWQALANATYLWNCGFNAFVKAGATRVKSDYDFQTATDQSVTQTKFLAGLGVGYQFTQELGVNFTYMHLFGTNYNDSSDLSTALTNNNASVMSANTYTIGFTYTLPM